jgi:hypothetical protein
MDGNQWDGCSVMLHIKAHRKAPAAPKVEVKRRRKTMGEKKAPSFDGAFSETNDF